MTPGGRRAIPFVATLVAVAAVGACVFAPAKRTLPALGPVTRIEIKDLMGTTLRTVEDADEVRRVVEFVDARRDGWGGANDWAGVPVPYLKAEFRDGPVFVGHFGVGANFFECHRVGAFLSRGASEAEIAGFLERVGLPGYDPDARSR